MIKKETIAVVYNNNIDSSESKLNNDPIVSEVSTPRNDDPIVSEVSTPRNDDPIVSEGSNPCNDDPIVGEKLTYIKGNILEKTIATEDNIRSGEDINTVLDTDGYLNFFKYLLDEAGVHFICIDNYSKTLLDDNYTHCQVFIFKDAKGERLKRVFYYFKSQEDMDQFKPILDRSDAFDYVIKAKAYDQRLYELCTMIKTSWFRDNQNIWNLAGFFARIPHTDTLLMLRTYLSVLKKMTTHVDFQHAAGQFQTWFDSNYICKLSESNLKSIAGGSNSEAYKEWKAQYEIIEVKEKKSKKKPHGIDLMKDFESIFESKRKRDTLLGFLKEKNKTLDEMIEAVCDTEYSEDELDYWAEEYCEVKTKPTTDMNMNYLTFEKMLKTTTFSSFYFLKRFILYFINDFYVFTMDSGKRCYYKRLPTEEDNSVITSYNADNFKNVVIKIKVEEEYQYKNLFDIFKQLPIHKFSNITHIWNYESDNTDTFSLANPFQAVALNEEVKESDLPEILIDYFKRIICDSNEEHWFHLREYLANVFHYPNYKPKLMVILYSPEKQIGKSTLGEIIKMIVGIANFFLAQALTNILGDRGAPQLIGKKVCWFEEISSSAKVYKQCMDRIKSAITDRIQSARELYHEERNVLGSAEFMGATNNLIGVVEDKMSIFKVNPAEKGNRKYWNELYEVVYNQHIMNQFYTYLKPFATGKVMTPIKTQTYKTMDEAGQESIVLYMNDLKYRMDAIYCDKKPTDDCNYYIIKRDILYRDYVDWCEMAGEKNVDKRSRFCSKLDSINRNITFKRYKDNNVCHYGFFIDKSFIEVDED